MQLLYLLAITAAAESIDLSASYFLPDEIAVAALTAASRRGVRVRIIVPGTHIDKKIVRWASRACWRPLLDAGVELHEFVPTMFHCKELIVDAAWVTVGSTNFDARSFSINDEANLNIYDRALAQRQGEVFEADLLRAKRVTLADWTARSIAQRVLERLGSLVRSQL